MHCAVLHIRCEGTRVPGTHMSENYSKTWKEESYEEYISLYLYISISLYHISYLSYHKIVSLYLYISISLFKKSEGNSILGSLAHFISFHSMIAFKAYYL